MTARSLLVPLASMAALLVASFIAHANPNPQQGRFLQRDPNASGQVVLNDTAWFHGQGAIIAPPMLDLRSLYGDGMNLYEYLGSNPPNRSDPMGLAWDPFDEAREIAAEHLWSQVSGLFQAIYLSRDGLRAIQANQRAGFLFMELTMDRDEAILLSMVGGPFFSTICFEGGTPVVLADGSALPIEAINLGAAVFSTSDPLSRGRSVVDGNAANPDPDAHERIDPASWRAVELRLDDAHRGTIRVSLLRPLAWFEVTGVQTGCQFRLALPEMGIAGTAQVVAIHPCPAVEEPAPGAQVITGTFVTERAEVVDVWCEGEPRPIGATASHPFYSEDRSQWVPAGQLRPGERVRTLEGSVRIERVAPRAAPTTVYNIEVHRSHTYYASDARILVHNPCSVNQVNQVIRRGNAPRTMIRAEKGRPERFEKPHIHFRDGGALNYDGTWKHGGRMLTNAEKEFIKLIEWNLP